MRLRLEDIRLKAEIRGVGYFEDVVSRGAVDGEWLELSEEAYNDLLQKYRQPPRLIDQAASLVGAVSRFARSGFTATPPEILAAREATCRACPEWEAKALKNTGRCRKCGCSTWAKLRMASESCPLGKWSAFDTVLKTEA